MIATGTETGTEGIAIGIGTEGIGVTGVTVTTGGNAAKGGVIERVKTAAAVTTVKGRTVVGRGERAGGGRVVGRTVGRRIAGVVTRSALDIADYFLLLFLSLPLS